MTGWKISACWRWPWAGLAVLGWISASWAALTVPTVTDNEGMSKYERINKVENDTIKISEALNQQEQMLNQQLQSLQEQNKKLMAEVEKLQTSFAALEKKWNSVGLN
jgi:phosphoglycerate-specific signal transduction histidine kinase